MARANSSQPRPKRFAISSRASEPLAKQQSAMKPPAGLPNTLPYPFGSVCGAAIAANMVSLVPRLTTAVPGALAPMPIRLDGLSPVNATTGVSGAKPYLCTK